MYSFTSRVSDVIAHGVPKHMAPYVQIHILITIHLISGSNQTVDIKKNQCIYIFSYRKIWWSIICVRTAWYWFNVGDHDFHMERLF